MAAQDDEPIKLSLVATDQQFGKYSRKSRIFITIIISLNCGLGDSKLVFRKIFKLMMMHQHTMFGYKRLSGSEDKIKAHRQLDTDSKIPAVNLFHGV